MKCFPKPKGGKFIGNAFIPNEDLKHIKKPLNDYEVLIGFDDLGDRGNFKLINRINGKVYIWKKSILQNKK